MNSATFTRIACVVLFGLSAGCGNDPSSPREPGGSITPPGVVPPAVVTVTINTPTQEALPIGSTSQYWAVLRDSAGNTLFGRSVAWSSSNTLVATVSSTGLVHAVGSGSAAIYAASEGRLGHRAMSVSDEAHVLGAITGVVLGDDGNALNDALLSIVATSTFAPYQQMSFSRDEGSRRSYSVASLHAGKWALTFSVIHGWTFVFPGLYLYADTTLIVDVVAGQTAVVPDLLMRSRPPLLLVGLETCPFALPDPPTLADWWSCDGGYWGGAAALITVTGVAGTNTASVHREGMIGPAAYTRPASFWQNTPWSTYFDMEILGDYDVTIALTPDASRPSWRLVPWQTTSRRVTVGKGLSYTEFDFWSK